MERYVMRIQTKNATEQVFDEIDLYFNGTNEDEFLMGKILKRALDSGYDVFMWKDDGTK